MNTLPFKFIRFKTTGFSFNFDLIFNSYRIFYSILILRFTFGFLFCCTINPLMSQANPQSTLTNSLIQNLSQNEQVRFAKPNFGSFINQLEQMTYLLPPKERIELLSELQYFPLIEPEKDGKIRISQIPSTSHPDASLTLGSTKKTNHQNEINVEDLLNQSLIGPLPPLSWNYQVQEYLLFLLYKIYLIEYQLLQVQSDEFSTQCSLLQKQLNLLKTNFSRIYNSIKKLSPDSSIESSTEPLQEDSLKISQKIIDLVILGAKHRMTLEFSQNETLPNFNFSSQNPLTLKGSHFQSEFKMFTLNELPKSINAHFEHLLGLSLKPNQSLWNTCELVDLEKYPQWILNFKDFHQAFQFWVLLFEANPNIKPFLWNEPLYLTPSTMLELLQHLQKSIDAWMNVSLFLKSYSTNIKLELSTFSSYNILQNPKFVSVLTPLIFSQLKDKTFEPHLGFISTSYFTLSHASSSIDLKTKVLKENLTKLVNFHTWKAFELKSNPISMEQFKKLIPILKLYLQSNSMESKNDPHWFSKFFKIDQKQQGQMTEHQQELCRFKLDLYQKLQAIEQKYFQKNHNNSPHFSNFLNTPHFPQFYFPNTKRLEPSMHSLFLAPTFEESYSIAKDILINWVRNRNFEPKNQESKLISAAYNASPWALEKIYHPLSRWRNPKKPYNYDINTSELLIKAYKIPQQDYLSHLPPHTSQAFYRWFQKLLHSIPDTNNTFTKSTSIYPFQNFYIHFLERFIIELSQNPEHFITQLNQALENFMTTPDEFAPLAYQTFFMYINLFSKNNPFAAPLFSEKTSYFKENLALLLENEQNQLDSASFETFFLALDTHFQRNSYKPLPQTPLFQWKEKDPLIFFYSKKWTGAKSYQISLEFCYAYWQYLILYSSDQSILDFIKLLKITLPSSFNINPFQKEDLLKIAPTVEFQFPFKVLEFLMDTEFL